MIIIKSSFLGGKQGHMIFQSSLNFINLKKSKKKNETKLNYLIIYIKLNKINSLIIINKNSPKKPIFFLYLHNFISIRFVFSHNQIQFPPLAFNRAQSRLNFKLFPSSLKHSINIILLTEQINAKQVIQAKILTIILQNLTKISL